MQESSLRLSLSATTDPGSRFVKRTTLLTGHYNGCLDVWCVSMWKSVAVMIADCLGFWFALALRGAAGTWVGRQPGKSTQAIEAAIDKRLLLLV